MILEFETEHVTGTWEVFIMKLIQMSFNYMYITVKKDSATLLLIIAIMTALIII